MASNTKKTMELSDVDLGKFRDDEEMALCLGACLEEGGVNLLMEAIGHIAKSRSAGGAHGNIRISYRRKPAGPPPFSAVADAARSIGVGIGFYPLSAGKRSAPRRRSAAIART